MNKNIWSLKEGDPLLIEKVAKENNLPQVLATLLVHRGLITKEQIELFMLPTQEKFHNPFLMKDMDKAVERILAARAAHEQITIYGDYDVDGITSTSILTLFLKEVGCAVDYYIPDRIEEGYGINIKALQVIKESGAQLVISVDTGITALKEIAYCQHELGLDLIVTDHHECGEELPQGLAVLNPKRADCTYPYDMLAGVGVTFKLIQGISQSLKMEDLVWKYLDLVAIGTIADLVPLQDENRIIVQLAFKNIANTWNIGLKTLMHVAGVKLDKITAGTIGFQIGPRLNAAGRLGDAKRGVELFITSDENRAIELAEVLNSENKRRQEIEQVILEQAIEVIENQGNLEKRKILVVAKQGWEHGVIGIVASRLVEKYYRPTILLTIDEGKASGSARSVEGFSIYEALVGCKDLFEKFGGHDMAAGMSLKEEHIELLDQRLNDYAHQKMTKETLTRKIKADLRLEVAEVTLEFIEKISLLEPYGMGNEEPKFIVKGQIKEIKTMGQKQNHLKVELIEGTNRLPAVGFNCAHFYDELAAHCPIEVIGTLNINEWQQKRNPQLMLRDLRLNDQYEQSILEHIDTIHQIHEDMKFVKPHIKPERKDFEKLYRFLLGLDSQKIHAITLPKLMDHLCGGNSELFMKHLVCLEVFKELELLSYDLQGIFINFVIFRGKKVELATSKLYNKWVE